MFNQKKKKIPNLQLILGIHASVIAVNTMKQKYIRAHWAVYDFHMAIDL